MRRVPEVIDVWFDSGSMPFAQFHAPHANLEHFEERFPADFVCEALDQTRGWFYSLLAVSTLLYDRSSFRNVVCLGLILDEQGRKMSKSLGNTVEPWEVIDRYGADALRWYFFTSKYPWDGYRLSMNTIERGGPPVPAAAVEHLRLLRPLRQRQRHRAPAHRPRRAVRPRPLGTVAAAGDGADRRRAPGGFRRHRRRPGDPGLRRRALQLVRAALAAAFLGGRPGGVLDTARVPDDRRQAAGAVLPVHRRRDLRQPRRRRAERAPVRLPRRPARATRSWRRRWRWRARPFAWDWPPAPRRRSRSASRCAPPSSSPPGTSGTPSSASPRSCARSSTSASCGSCRRPTSSARSSSSPTTGRWGRASASRCRRWRWPSPRSTRATSRRRCARVVRCGSTSAVPTTHLDADDLLISMKPLEGYQVEREGSHAVALETTIDESLRVEGWARDIVRAVQNARQAAGLGRLRPDPAHARRRSGAARRRPPIRGLSGQRDAGDGDRLRGSRRGAGHDRRPAAEDRRGAGLARTGDVVNAVDGKKGPQSGTDLRIERLVASLGAAQARHRRLLDLIVRWRRRHRPEPVRRRSVRRACAARRPAGWPRCARPRRRPSDRRSRPS